MIEITLKESIIEEISDLNRAGKFFDTISHYGFERVLKNTNENLFKKLVLDEEYFKEICIIKFKQISTSHYFKPLFSLADNIFNDENDGTLLDDILIRLGGIPISKYFYDNHWSLNIHVHDYLDDCIKMLSDRLTKEMYNSIGDEFFKIFERKGYTISIDKNYCNSNFRISEVNYKYDDTGCNRNFRKISFESLVVRIDKVDLIKKRLEDESYVMEFHKERYKLQ